MGKARDEAGNIWETDAQGNAVRLLQPASPGIGPAIGNDPKAPFQLQQAQGQAAAAPYAAPKAATDLRGGQLGNERTAQSIGLDRVNAMQALVKQFASDPRVDNYRSIMPQLADAMTQPDTAAGDLAIVYAFGKVMDPGSVVREGEMSMAQQTASLKGQLASYVGMLNQGKRLPADTRKNLIDAMRNRAIQYNRAYIEARSQFKGLATEAGFKPEDIIGPHDGDKYHKIELDYKAADKITDADVRDFILKNQGMDREALKEYAEFKLGGKITNLDQVMDTLEKTGQLSHRVNRNQTAEDLRGLAKGGLHVWDRAAQGLASVFGDPSHSFGMPTADEAAASRETAPFFQNKASPGWETVGKIGAGGLLSAPFANPFVAGAVAGGAMGDSTGLGVAADMGLGAIGGKLGDAAVKGTAQLIAPQLDSSVRSLVSEGARLTPGRFFPSLKKAEDLARSYPIVGSRIDDALTAAEDSVNRIPPQRILGKIGQELPEDVPTGHAAVDYTQKALSNGYNNTLAGRRVSLDPTFITRLNYLGQRSGLRPQELATLDDTIQREIGGAFLGGRGTIGAKDLKRLDERLGDLGAGLRAMDDPFQRQLGGTMGQVKDQLGALVRRQNPDIAANLRLLDDAYADFVPYQRAASSSVEDGIATPGQFRSAVRQSDRSLRKGRTAKGEARLQDFAADASKVLPATRGNSGSAERLNLASPKAWALGTALAPLYSKPALNAINRAASRDPGLVAQLIADTVKRLPGGMFGSALPLYIEP